MIPRYHGIVLALDAEDETSALELVRAAAGYVDAIKIGYQLILNTDLDILRTIRREGVAIPAIADLKITDAPHIAKRMTEAAFKAGYSAVTVSAVCGRTAIRGCVEVAGQYSGLVIAFLEFSQLDGLITSDTADHGALLACEEGAHGILAPGTRPSRISQLRAIVGRQCEIFSCGIGAQGPEPGSAIRSGADFEIIGRTICDSADPQQAASNISKNLRAIISSSESAEGR